MEMIENPMVLPKYEYKSDHIDDDVWTELEDMEYEELVFEEMLKED